MSSSNVTKKPLIIGGKLKLKGSGLSGGNGSAPRRAESQVTVSGKKRSAEEIETNPEAPSSSSSSITNSTVQMTEAQRRFKEKQRQLEERQLKKVASKPYRERVEEFNEKLSKLTEHNDIPRISAAGNG